MESYSIYRFLIQAFVALLFVNAVHPATTIDKDAHLTKEVRVPADLLRFQGRIVNGSEATLGQFPYQVSLRFTSTGQHFCGGSIIRAEWIITAGHCIWGQDPGEITIVAGDILVNETSSTSHRTVGIKIIPHRALGDRYLASDLALIKVEKPFIFDNSAVQSIPWRRTKVSEGTVCQVSGWGALESGAEEGPNELMYVDVPILNTDTCADNYEEIGLFEIGMICAGYAEGLRDACQGDSGGPLNCNGVLTGIVSFGYGCALPNYPGVYTDVWFYQDWISEQIRENGAGSIKFSIWTTILSFSVIGLVTRS